MKKILSLAAVASMALAAHAEKSPYQDMNYKDWGKLYLNGNQLSSTITKKEVQLKGWSTFSMHYKGKCDLTKGNLELMKQYGANIVRLAMYVDDPSTWDGGAYKQNDGTDNNNRTFRDQVVKAIKWAKELDMYVLVDWHILRMDNGSSGDPNDYTDMAKKFFEEISKYCNDNEYDHVLYEICNEPTCGWDNIKSYARDVIPSITNNQPDAIIVVGTDQWCQEISKAADSPLENYKKNVMYSFHYYACSHYGFLGDFCKAQKKVPVFVSEWSSVKFDGNGPFCKSSADEMLADCEYDKNLAPQVVSWCLWNWGTKDEASSFFQLGGCNAGNESTYKDTENQVTYGDYVKTLMMGELRDVEVRETGKYESINEIPTSKNSLWRWDYYDLGGENVAYHDGNGGAYEKDGEGVYLDYKVGPEFDIFSLAYDMMWLPKRHNLAVIDRTNPKKPVVKSWDSSVNTEWKTGEGDDKKPTYRSLNGGRMYGGTDASDRSDEGVDISNASLAGTSVKTKHTVMAFVEEDEWINYTINVAEPGYYKISGYISAEYLGNGAEISLTSNKGNLLRDESNLTDNTKVTEFGFTKLEDDSECAKSGTYATPWDCWDFQDAKNKKVKSVVCAFPKTGEQELYVKFVGNAGGVGPLQFEKVADIDPNDPITSVEEVSNDSEFAIYPNPTSGEFTVVLADNTEATVEVVNMAGQIVASQVVEGTATINKALAAGIYTVVVKANGSVSTQKLVVK